MTSRHAKRGESCANLDTPLLASASAWRVTHLTYATPRESSSGLPLNMAFRKISGRIPLFWKAPQTCLLKFAVPQAYVREHTKTAGGGGVRRCFRLSGSTIQNMCSFRHVARLLPVETEEGYFLFNQQSALGGASNPVRHVSSRFRVL